MSIIFLTGNIYTHIKSIVRMMFTNLSGIKSIASCSAKAENSFAAFT
ncbi:MAG: hypothetical protein ACLFSQ_05450 [Candidatus Zixiibacteriota bacterium]